MTLRFAVPSDAPTLLSIYQQSIPTTVTFEYELPSQEEFVRRITTMSAVYPYLVLEEDGQVLGYAYAHQIGERTAYRYGAELSIYLDQRQKGRGLGKRLYGVLIHLLRLQGVRTVYGLVASPNPASEALHQTLGFHVMGIQSKAGYKNGQWIDLIWYEMAILPYDETPAPVIPIHQLPWEEVRLILSNF